MSRKDEMRLYLPKYYDESKEVNAKIDAEGKEFDELRVKIYDVLDQFFVNTATWGLDIWEKELGIPTNYNESYEVRRARILSKLSVAGTFTPLDAEVLANSYDSADKAKYIRIQAEYEFKTQHNVDFLIDFVGMTQAFEELKPAHLLHVKGLLIRENLSPIMQRYFRMRGWAFIDYSPAMKEPHLIVVRGGYAVTSDWTRETWSPYSYLNGSWQLNGNWLNGDWKLDGKNPLTEELYSIQSDVLTIREYKNGTLVNTEVLHEKAMQGGIR
ncbi:putative phage tail protein [Fredinandcohnia humi]